MDEARERVCKAAEAFCRRPNLVSTWNELSHATEAYRKLRAEQEE